MISYLVKLWVLIIFSACIIFFYYSNTAHIENFDGYLFYLFPLFIIYGVYKYLSIIGLKTIITFTPIKIFGLFELQLLILSILFFSYNGDAFGIAVGNGLTLFFKIFFYSVFPIVITIVNLALGKRIGGLLIENYSEKSANYRFLVGLGLGFFAFIFALTIIGMLGAYNLGVFFILGIIFIVFSYKELGKILSGLISHEIKCTNHKIYSKDILEQVNPKLLTTEFLFVIITLILSINLISIFRPFPIGWDDLGAYMNFPHLMANSGYVGELGGMMSWQTFTGIGYMFSNPTLAFFLNSVGGFLSVIVIGLIMSEVFKDKKESFINLPLLSAALFISMPMIIFQQAKDMKSDVSLFFISIIALYMLFEFYITYVRNKKDKKLLSATGVLKLFFAIGLLLGFTFTIKGTSLLLISAIFGILFYTRLGILGFLGYLSVYFSIFTGAGLWKRMNVIGLDDPDFKLGISIVSFIIGVIFLLGARIKTLKKFRRFVPRMGVLFFGMLLAIAPWGINNIVSVGQVNISALLGGKPQSFKIDYTKIHSESDLEIIESSSNIGKLNSSGTTTNEDWGRYFGYEKGINNYVKLPWNLTMQTNQGGEFTTIGFLFLALLPTVFLFLPFRKRHYSLGVYALLTFEILLFVIPASRDFFTQLMGGLGLPYGYLFILLLALLPLVFFIPTLQNKELLKLFKINLVFAIFYTFLWGISAFGVVWYGIVMYFNFILMILFGVYYLGGYSKDDSRKDIQLKFFGTLIFISIVGIYMFWSVIPHSFINLKSAGYKDYKVGNITIAEAPYLFHKEYLPILYHLNIANDKREDFLNEIISSKQIKDIIKNNGFSKDILAIETLLKQIKNDSRLDTKIKGDADSILQDLYAGISNPAAEYKNTVGIYRIGTFLKYHISENNKRLFEDSLVEKFAKYIYHKDADISVERIKKLGIHYFLVDLNAATIDKDPRHALTKRYEDLLKTFTSEKLELVDTDSICLKIALDDYKKDKDLQAYTLLAGVNYETYNSDKSVIKRQDKLLACYEQILDIHASGKISSESYPYLELYKPHLDNLKTDNEKLQFIHQYLGHGYKVLFRVK